ncbi:MAG TPA: hypothetical protein VGH27_01665 [Streptosporangiaceae bacterium]|jgi:hypothetical protein
MTWTKLSDDFADDCARARLSDAAFRTHVEGLIWTMRRETGGQLDARDVRRAIEAECPGPAIAELAEAGFWAEDGDGWLIMHAMSDQPEPDVIAKRRTSTKERVRKYRREKAGLDPNAPPPRNGVTARVTERVTRVGSGRDYVPTDPTLNGQDQSQDQSEGPARLAAMAQGGPGGWRSPPGTATAVDGSGQDHSVANSQTRRVHNGSIRPVPDVQQIPVDRHVQSQATEGDARAGERLTGTRPATLRRREALRHRIASHITAEPGCSTSDLQATIRGNRQHLLTELRQLIDNGSVILRRDPADRRVHRYYPASAGHEAAEDAS